MADITKKTVFKADSDSEEDPLVTGEPDIWKFIPHSSKYQYAVVITLSYVAFTNGWIIMWAVFGQYTPPFRCRSVLDNTTLAETASFQTMHDLVANLSAPEYREAYGQQCLTPDISIDDCDTDIVSCVSNMSNLTTSQCMEPIYDYAQLNTRASWTGAQWRSLSTELNIICSQSYLNTILIQATLVGIMCGSFFGGIMTDKLGRKRTTEFCLFGIALALVLPVVTIRFLPDNLFMLKYLIVLLCRLAICGFEQASWISGSAYGVELLGPSRRHLSQCFFQIWYSMGYITSSAVGYFCPDWVDYSVLVIIFLVLMALVFYKLPRSVVYLFRMRKYDQAEETLTHLAKRTNSIIPDGFVEDYKIAVDKSLESNNKMVETKTEFSMLDLYRHARMRRIHLTISFIFSTTAMVYYGLSFNASGLPGSLYVNNAMFGIACLLSNLFAITMIPRFGRRTLMIMALFMSSACCFGSMLFLRLGETSQSSWQTQIGRWMAFGGLFGATLQFNLIYIYFVELFPTNVRGKAIGLASIFARFGGIIAPMLTRLESENQDNVVMKSVPSVVFSTVALVAGLVAFSLPETKGMKLLETMEEANEFYGNNEKRISRLCRSNEESEVK